MIVFQTADITHTQLLAALVNSAYRGEYSLQGWTTEASILDGQRTDPESLAALIQAPRNQIEMALHQETKAVMGCVHLVQEELETLYFGMLTVEPKMQATGIGKLLLNHIEATAKVQKLKRIRFTVIPSRIELIAFYKRRGFKKTGVVEEFPSNQEKFGIPKMTNLELHEYEKFI